MTRWIRIFFGAALFLTLSTSAQALYEIGDMAFRDLQVGFLPGRLNPGHNGILLDATDFGPFEVDPSAVRIIEVRAEHAGLIRPAPGEIVIQTLADFQAAAQFRGIFTVANRMSEASRFWREKQNLLWLATKKWEGREILYRFWKRDYYKNPTASPPRFRSDGFTEYLYEQVGVDLIRNDGVGTFPKDRMQVMSPTSGNPPRGGIFDKVGRRLPESSGMGFAIPPSNFNPSLPPTARANDQAASGSGIGRIQVKRLARFEGGRVVEDGTIVLDRSFSPPRPSDQLEGGNWAVVETISDQDGVYELSAWDGAGNRSKFSTFTLARQAPFEGRVRRWNAKKGRFVWVQGAQVEIQPVRTPWLFPSFEVATGWGASAGMFSTERTKVPSGLYRVSVMGKSFEVDFVAGSSGRFIFTL